MGPEEPVRLPPPADTKAADTARRDSKATSNKAVKNDGAIGGVIGVRESFRHHRYWMPQLDPVSRMPITYHKETVKFDAPEFRPVLRVLAGLHMGSGLPRT